MCQSDCAITPGLYAMVGAAAALGGVTRMTGKLPEFYIYLFVWGLTTIQHFFGHIMVVCLPNQISWITHQ